MKVLLQSMIKALLILWCADKHLIVADNPDAASVGKLRSSAEVAFSKGDVDQALRLWTQVIAVEPGNETNFYKRFRIYLRQNKLKEAISDLSAALAIKPDYEAVLAQRAKLQLKVGRCSDAKNDFDKLRR
jgi:predicted Zn-dependent protease